MHLIERAAARLAIVEEEGRPADAAAQLAAYTPSPTVNHEKHPKAISSDVLAKAGLIDSRQQHSRIADELRVAQTRLIRESLGASGRAVTELDNLILVTSALPGEGKSFISLNLAAAIARHGDRRVLVVDADMKPRSLGYLLGISGAPGLLDLARSSDRHIEEFIVPTEVERLDVLPLGSNRGDGSELLAGVRIAELVHHLARTCAGRTIIFDAPPCLYSSSPHFLAALVGQVILIVAAASTQQTDVEAALNMVQDCPRVSLLLNKIPRWTVHSFGSYNYLPPPG